MNNFFVDINNFLGNLKMKYCDGNLSDTLLDEISRNSSSQKYKKTSSKKDERVNG